MTIEIVPECVEPFCAHNPSNIHTWTRRALNAFVVILVFFFFLSTLFLLRILMPVLVWHSTLWRNHINMPFSSSFRVSFRRRGRHRRTHIPIAIHRMWQPQPSFALSFAVHSTHIFAQHRAWSHRSISFFFFSDAYVWLYEPAASLASRRMLAGFLRFMQTSFPCHCYCIIIIIILPASAKKSVKFSVNMLHTFQAHLLFGSGTAAIAIIARQSQRINDHAVAHTHKWNEGSRTGSDGDQQTTKIFCIDPSN